MRADGRTGLVNLIVAFRSFAKAPKKFCIFKIVKISGGCVSSCGMLALMLVWVTGCAHGWYNRVCGCVCARRGGGGSLRLLYFDPWPGKACNNLQPLVPWRCLVGCDAM
jgi:hypothetical protein